MIKCKAVFASDNDFFKPIGEMKIKQLGLLKGYDEIVHWCSGKDKKMRLHTTKGSGRWCSVVLDEPDTHRNLFVRILHEGDKIIIDKKGKLTVEWELRAVSTLMCNMKIGNVAEIITGKYRGKIVDRRYDPRRHSAKVRFYLGGDSFSDKSEKETYVRLLGKEDRLVFVEE